MSSPHGDGFEGLDGVGVEGVYCVDGLADFGGEAGEVSV